MLFSNSLNEKIVTADTTCPSLPSCGKFNLLHNEVQTRRKRGKQKVTEISVCSHCTTISLSRFLCDGAATFPFDLRKPLPCWNNNVQLCVSVTLYRRKR